MQAQTEPLPTPTPAAALTAAPRAAAPPQPERRKGPRFPCQGTAKVIVLGGALTFIGIIRDLSAAGCCILTEVVFTLERGTQVEVLMVVNHTSFRVAAGVRSNDKLRGVGLEFMNVSARSVRLIHDLIAELDAQQKHDADAPSA
jgi:hypothetical protein